MVLLSRPGLRATAVLASAVAALAALPPGFAAAHPKPPAGAPTVVARGLDNPRQVSWSGGALYVAEAGVGGTGPCITSPEGGPACLGASGAITEVRAGRQRRVVTGLPSVAGAEGTNAVGPTDVLVRGKRFTVSLGLGADPAVRASLPAAGRQLATVATGRLGRPGLHVVADVGAYEARVNPDGKQVDTNPVALLQRGRRTFVVDAGGNSLLQLKGYGRLRTAAVFPTTRVPAPPPLGLPPGTLLDMDAVPTAAAYGPDGALYVSQLTGFPFPVGGASIWRVVPGAAPVRWATGLTMVTDLAFGRDGSLYAVQLADEGLLAPAPSGSVVRIPAGGGAAHQTIADNLRFPYGIAVRGGAAYVTTCATCPDEGELLRVPLDHHRS